MATKVLLYFSRYVMKYHVIANMFVERFWHFQVPNPTIPRKRQFIINRGDHRKKFELAFALS